MKVAKLKVHNALHAANIVDSETMEAERKKAGQTDTVDSYEVAFERIREITCEEDIDRIVLQFIEVEDENFALFNFVSDQNNRVEYLHYEIEEVQWLVLVSYYYSPF